MLYSCHFRFFILLIIAVITLCLWIQPQPGAATLINNGRKDSCNRRCGNVDVLYPFGIGIGCSYNEYFAITCNSSSSSSSSSYVPFLKVLDLEVVEIPFDPYNSDNLTGVLVVKTPLVTTCRGNNNDDGNNTRNNSDGITEARWTSPNMSGTPFNVYEYDLIFASVGCDGYAELYNETGGFVLGCSSVCDPPPPKGLNKTECIGYGCCQRELDYETYRGYTVSVKVDKRSTGCRSAFLISKDYYFGANNASNMTAIPVRLRWNIDRVHPPSHESFDLSWAIYVGPSVGTLLLTCAIFWSCWLSKTRKRRKELKLRTKYFKRRLEEQGSTNREVIENTKLFTIKELKKATDNFNKDRVLGKGGQGTVYKGMLMDGQVVAVKKSKEFDESQWQQFMNEVILLSLIKHRHVVKLLGCCLETKEPLLVYEFVPNGTLFEHIHKSTKEFLLTWEMRVRIASEIASTIGYLHSDCPTPILHRDIKSSNILLDDKYIAKVSDFGISRAISIDQTHLTTRVQGTFGYLDPEYFRLSQFSEKSDVYSFGVILVELLTGQKPIRAPSSEGGEEASLVEYFITSMNDSTLYNILHPIVLEGNAKDDIMIVANLAKECLNPRGVQRPTMKEVAAVIDRLRNKSSSLPMKLNN